MSKECNFSKLTVKQLQLELIRRGALTNGRKQDLLSYIIYRHSSREESVFLLLYAYRMRGDASHSPTTNV